MTVTLYSSTDTGAPTMGGRVGGLLNILDACLVNGYGSGGTAKAAAGWSISYTGTNQRVYTQGSGSTGSSYYVNDNVPAGYNDQYASIVGLVSPTGLGVGARQYPLTSQMSSGALVYKSNTDDGSNVTVRPWMVLADQTCCYIMIQDGWSGTNWNCYAFGDIEALSQSDPYCGMVIGLAGGISWNNIRFATSAGGITDYDGAHFMNADITGQKFSQNFGKFCPMSHYMNAQGYDGTQNGENSNPTRTMSGNNPVSPLSCPFPNGADGGIILLPVRVNAANGLRGTMKGLWYTPHHWPMNGGDRFTCTRGAYTGKTFMAINTIYPSFNSSISGCQIFFEISNTWPNTYPSS
jgi:hypothetical protein